MIKKIQKSPKRHHIVSRFYIAQFSDRLKIEILNLKNKTRRNVDIKSLSNFCVQNDFNTIKHDNYSSDFIEKVIGKLEKKAKNAINNISNNKKFEGEDREIVLELLACFFIRKPEIRNSFNESTNQCYKVKFDLMSRMPVGSIVNGYEITEDFHQALQNRNNIEITYNRTSLIAMELKALNEVLPLLHTRKWLLLCAPNNSHFVTSDRPVVLIWKDNKIKSSPGLGHSNTQIFFPLSKNYAIIGDFEGADGTITATEKEMALINSNIRAFARLWIFTPNSDFHYLDDNNKVIKNSGEFF